MDKHGNKRAKEGCDRCPCGAKYWEYDLCVSCGAPFGSEVPGDKDPNRVRRFPTLAQIIRVIDTWNGTTLSKREIAAREGLRREVVDVIIEHFFLTGESNPAEYFSVISRKVPV